jgi:8-oxo-dGTP diphosphatase
MSRGGKVLIQKRDAHCKNFPNQFCFPGGRIDKGETPEEAVIREIEEETGKKGVPNLTPLLDFKYRLNGETYFNRFFISCSLNQFEPVSTEGKMLWFSEEEMKRTKFVLNEDFFFPILSIFFDNDPRYVNKEEKVKCFSFQQALP